MIKFDENLVCKKGKDDCVCLACSIYENDFYCIGIKSMKGVAPIRFCSNNIQNDFYPDEALSISNLLLRGCQEFLDRFKPYGEYRVTGDKREYRTQIMEPVKNANLTEEEFKVIEPDKEPNKEN